MPWKAFKVKNEFCVFRINSSGKRFGNSLGCHSSRNKANAQVATLNINVDEKEEKNVEIPTNPFGYTVADTFEKLSRKGTKYSKSEANYRQPAESSTITCGACRFYLRSPESEIGSCQVVKGSIPWFGTSDFYINSEVEARASFANENAYVGDERKRPQKENSVTEKTEGLVEVETEVEDDEKLMGLEITGPAMSFQDVDDANFAMERASEIQHNTNIFKALVDNVVAFSPIDEIPAQLGKLVDGLRSRLSKATNSVMKQKITPFMVYKENNQWRFLTTYSNNIRDDDNPPEIISAESHRNFVDMVDKGLVPMPELWLWHTKELRIGEVDIVAFDEETGVALAAGNFFDFAAPLAKIIADNPDKWGVSHGMKVQKRNSEDFTIIEEHITQEISPLSNIKAANRWADFIALKEADTMLTEEKLKEFEALGIGTALIATIQENNVKLSKQADDLGLERKEETPPAEETPAPVVPVEETPTTPAPEPTPEPVTPAPEVEPEAVPLVEEIPVETPEAPTVETPAATPVSDEEPVPSEAPEASEAPTSEFTKGQMNELVVALSSIAENITKTVTETVLSAVEEKLAPVVTESEETKSLFEEAYGQTPAASLQESILAPIINGTFLKGQSALNGDGTLVDKRTSLAKDGPAEHEQEEQFLQSGNSFIDSLAGDIITQRNMKPLAEKEKQTA